LIVYNKKGKAVKRMENNVLVWVFAFFLVAAAGGFAQFLIPVNNAHAGKKNIIGGALGGASQGTAANRVLGNDQDGKNRKRPENRKHRKSTRNDHVDWCYENRLRYRESDNTFRRRGGARVECVSPFTE
jgi:hypothetical protein